MKNYLKSCIINNNFIVLKVNLSQWIRKSMLMMVKKKNTKDKGQFPIILCIQGASTGPEWHRNHYIYIQR
jgi:hypothetical protein